MQTKRQYEVVFIVDPTADEEVQRLTDGFSQIVTDQGGVITKAETMGKRQLAYEINHHKDGTFVLLEIEGSGREIAELERRMRVNDRVLRYLTVRVDEDRRRAEKLKDRRARKAAKRPSQSGHGGGPARRGATMEFAEAAGE
jgi:small subunit ribosomal protein S6